MPVSNHQSVIRQYLLGHLTDDEQANVEQRLVVEDDFFEELEVVKDEVVEEYLAGQLTTKEKQRLEEKFLASPEGRSRLGFTRALNRYVETHPQTRKKASWGERFAALWATQPILTRAAAGFALIAIVVGSFWFMRPSPTFATLTLSPAAPTRSTGDDSTVVDLNGQGLRLNLLLPESTNQVTQYRVELSDAEGQTRILQPAAQTPQLVTVEIPPGQLRSGPNAVILKWHNEQGEQRVPGTYFFTVK